MLPERIFLVDRDGALVAAWKEVFRDDADVVVAERRDFFELNADAMVSPANSFGIMDGGLDASIRTTLVGVEARVREVLATHHHGELHVGMAEIVETDDHRWRYLACAPTMRVPEDVSRTVNAYVAFRAVLLAIRRHNAAGALPPIRSVLCPGLCTGVGAMPARRCAAQMRIAYKQLRASPELPRFDAIYEAHRAMRTVT
jgi:O-acetyl-ADP-ribose deacetylase (regulator of RNase III)